MKVIGIEIKNNEDEWVLAMKHYFVHGYQPITDPSDIPEGMEYRFVYENYTFSQAYRGRK